MADGEKITTRLEVDVTDFKKGLSDANRYIRLANSEFENATAGMGKWSDSADGLRAKLTQLERTLEGQEAAASTLRNEYDRVVAEQGETSKGAQELAIKLNKQEAACKKTASQIEHYRGALDDMEKSSDDAGDEAKKLGDNLEDVEGNAKDADKATGGLADAMGKAAKSAGNLVTGMAKLAGKSIVSSIKAIATASTALVGAFLATGETSKEWIANMNKLDAVAKETGKRTEVVRGQFQELYGILGDETAATTTVSNLQAIGLKQKGMESLTNSMAGIWAKYGDSIPLDGLAEAVNHSSKLGSVQGNLADALEWAGITVDDFNAKLEACATPAKRQQLIVETLDSVYGSLGETYKEQNANIIDSNKATATMNDALAQVGESSMPVMTAIKLMGAGILTDLLPNIKQLGEAFPEALNGSKTAAEEIGTAVSGMLQQLIQKFTTALPQIITVGTSIIGSLVQGIIAAVPALADGAGQIVQHFIQAAPEFISAGSSMIANLLQGIAAAMPSIIQQAGSLIQSIVSGLQTGLPQILAAGGEVVFQLLSGIVNNLPQIAQGAMDAISGFVTGFQTYLPIIMEKGREIISNLGNGIRENLPSLVNQALDALMNFATTLYDNAPTLIETGFDLLSNLVQGILDCIPALLSKGPEIISKFANIINDNFPTILKKGVELIWQIIKGIISAIPELIRNIPQIITAIVDVWEAFNWLNLGKKAITFLKDGVLKMVSSVKSAGKTIMSSITDVIKDLPGKLLEFGKNAITKLGSSISGGLNTVKSAAGEIFNGIVNYFKDLPGKLLSIGKDLVTGLWNGISDMTGWIIGKIQGFGENVLGGIKDFFKIGSPSKVMATEVGKWLPAGMADGITSNTKAATKAMTNMAKDALGAANSALSGGISVPVSGSAAAASGGRAAGATYVFNQYNNSPKSLSRADIYRQTKNALRFATQ